LTSLSLMYLRTSEEFLNMLVAPDFSWDGVR